MLYTLGRKHMKCYGILHVLLWVYIIFIRKPTLLTFWSRAVSTWAVDLPEAGLGRGNFAAKLGY